MRRYDLISSLAFVICGVAIAAGSLPINVGTFRDPGPGLFPFITGILMCLIAGGVFAFSWLQSGSAAGEAPRADKRLWHVKSVTTVAILLIYAIAFEWLGFATDTFLVLLILFKAIGGLSLRASLGGAILTAAIVYLVFKVWLNVQLPAGPLGL